MSELSYSKIFELIQDCLPDNWRKVIFYSVIAQDSFSMKYFVERGNGILIDCFSASNVNRMKLHRTFMEVYSIIDKHRMSLPENERWSSIILIIKSDGKFKVKVDYDIFQSYQQKIYEIEEMIKSGNLFSM